MVVCLVVRIRNESTRTFTVTQAGDPFYNPKVDGQACGGDPVEIEPGTDSLTEGLVVPWAATTRCGLVVHEDGCPEGVRCVVGPADDDAGHDWLRLHGAAWEPLAEERWLALGKRHLLGAVGGVVELQLTFREPASARALLPSLRRVPGEPGARVRLKGLMVSTELNGSEATCIAWDDSEQRWTVRLDSREMRAVKAENLVSLQAPEERQDARSAAATRIATSILFERESACAPANTVFLNVYDLAAAASIPNSMLCNSLVKTVGAFHAAVEVYGEEWGFYRQPNPEDCGICRSRQPRKHPVHVYRQSVNLGKTTLRDWEVWNLIRWDIIPQWPSSRYDLIRSNCIHFCDEMLKKLGVDAVPAWVRGLHENAAAILKVPWPLSLMYDTGGNGPPAVADAAAAKASPEASDASLASSRVPEGARQDPQSGGAQAEQQQTSQPRRPSFLPQTGDAGHESDDSEAESFASLDVDDARQRAGLSAPGGGGRL